MNCQVCEQVMSGSVCVCGWSVRTLAAPSDWITRECPAPHCTVIIRERPGRNGSAFCKWCHAKGVTVYATPVREVATLKAPEFITKEQFGLALYDCIQKFSEREWLREEQQRTEQSLRLSPLERRLKIEQLKKREAHVNQECTDLIGQIAPADAKRILGKYEAAVCA